MSERLRRETPDLDATAPGATLDVFEEEPLPPGHWLWTQPFVTITPHVSAMTMRREAVAQVAQGVQALALGEAPPGLVQRGRGY